MFNRPLHTALIAAIATVSVAGIALPAQAAEAASDTVKLEKVQRNGNTVYCAKQSNTGSRVPQRVCMSKSEWANRGAIINDNTDEMATVSKSRDGQS